MHVIGSLQNEIGIALAFAQANLQVPIIVVDNFDHDEQMMRLQEEHHLKIQIKPLPVIEAYSEPKYRPSKHHCYRKQKPRKNKMQSKSRRINRK